MLKARDIRSIVALCTFGDWEITIGTGLPPALRPYLQVKDPKGRCNTSGKPAPWHGRKWDLTYHMTKSEIVQTAFKAVLTAVEHETRENFKYRGEAIFGPHFDVDKLVDLASQPDAKEVRT